MIPVFRGKVDKGKMVMDDEDLFSRYLESITGYRFELSISKEDLSKTIPQLKYLNGVVYKIISDETGYTRDEVDKLMKSKFLNVDTLRFISRKDLIEYIDNIKTFAAKDLGIYIPDSKNVC